MANAFELITKYSTKAWDKTYKAESRSALLDGDKELLKFVGVKTVKIAKFSSTGLSDYARANAGVSGNYAAGAATDFASGNGYGYKQGAAALTWEEFTISCDRAAQYRIELFDDEETDGLAVATTTTEVSRTQVVPEVDAYCFSKIAEYAGKSVTETIGLSAGQVKPLAALNAGFKHLEDVEVPEEDQIVFCSTEYRNILRSTDELYRKLDQAEYDKDIKFTIESYEGRKIIAVPPRRFRTLINLVDGGYTWKSGSVAINFIVCAKSAIYHVTKYDKVRVFQPNVVQDFDGYKVNIRVYHDVFVPDNKRDAIYVSLSNATTAPTTSISYTLDSNNRLVNVVTSPADALVTFYACTSAGTVGNTFSAASGDVEVKPYTVLTNKLVASTPYYLTAVNVATGKIEAVAATSFQI